VIKKVFQFIFVLGCAAGPPDVLDPNGGSADASVATPQTGYAYVARRALVAVALADSKGFSDDETHAVIDRVADAASACFKKSANLKVGAVRVIVAVDNGGVAGAPDVTFSPQESAPIGLLCVLAPIRFTKFAPSSADAGDRSITIESAWGQ
jgi:hypothetical protein